MNPQRCYGRSCFLQRNSDAPWCELNLHRAAAHLSDFPLEAEFNQNVFSSGNNHKSWS